MNKILIFLSALLLMACGPETADEVKPEMAAATPEFSVSESGVKTKNVEGFGGIIAESYSDSKEWWPTDKTP